MFEFNGSLSMTVLVCELLFILTVLLNEELRSDNWEQEDVPSSAKDSRASAGANVFSVN
jgi:hypothetical protein